MSENEQERTIVLTKEQHLLLQAADEALRQAKSRQALVVSGILAAAGIAAGEVMAFDDDTRTLRVRVV